MENRLESGFIGRRQITAWFMLLLILTFLLIVWGAFVRLTGSGLSIPEWPIINGSLFPPTSDAGWQEVFKTYYLEVHNITEPTGPDVMPLSRFKTMFAIEYIHRFIAALVGLLFLVLLWFSLRHKNRRKLIGDLMIVAFLMLFIQVLLGGIVVREDLKAFLVAAHLGTAYMFFALMLWGYLKLSLAATVGEIPRTTKGNKLLLFSAIASIALFFQIVSGGLMAGSGAGHILNTFPKMGDAWIPGRALMFSDIYGGLWQNLTENRVLIQFIHRWWLIVVVITVGLMHGFSKNATFSKWGRLAKASAGIILLVQFSFGVGNLMMKVPVYMSVIHSAIALLLFVSLIMVVFEARFEGQK